MDLNKKRIVITGGGSGIGLAMARSLASLGSHVVIAGRDQNKLVAAAPVYSASKAFLHSYTQSLREQLAETSVRVVELLPPVVDTPLAADLDSSFPRISPEKLVAELIKWLKSNVDEITPGQSMGWIYSIG